MTEPLSLFELWALPLAEQQRRRPYLPWGNNRAEMLAKDNAAPDFPKVGPFYVLKEQRSGRTLIVDPRRPWNDARVFAHDLEDVARAWAVDKAAAPKGSPPPAPPGPVGGGPKDRTLSPKDEIGNFDPWSEVEELTF